MIFDLPYTCALNYLSMRIMWIYIWSFVQTDLCHISFHKDLTQ